MSWSFTLPVVVPSANVLKRALWGGNRARYSRERASIRLCVATLGRGVPRATGYRRVRITRVMGARARQYDHDNLVAGAKALLDELVHAQIILGDAPHQVSVEYAQERGDKAYGETRIEVDLR